MNLTFTPAAIRRIELLRGDLPGRLHLDYSTDGCVCENSGIFRLRLVTEPTSEDTEFTSNLGPILIKKWTAVFLEEVLTIDFDPKTTALILKSDGQYYNQNLLFADTAGNFVYPNIT
ncbi:hypothetical protein HCA00_01390 [Listeria booriae]|uniref:iron-sulfur cluster biosynthesis family protein n=1 Tax=Listeria booriae TaxID=1552123 RepID=UPI001627C1D3|nr:iron-sulfur cluster biosynthesis family protein [Listeria booriae]MBC1945552.1 hypothetical protein [Listeria booriae]MBC6127457.1 hypothetical protein [Listeria booriae]